MTTHPLFDPDWYRNQNPELPPDEINLQHYLKAGWRNLSSPHPLFSTKYYFQARPDVREAGLEPLTHFLTRGWKEGTGPHPLFDLDFYLSQMPELEHRDPLSHYLMIGWKQGLRANDHFGYQWYLKTYPDVREAGLDPLMHYLTTGWIEGRLPFSNFDPSVYEDLSASRPDWNPLLDFVENGTPPARSPEYDPVQDISLDRAIAAPSVAEMEISQLEQERFDQGAERYAAIREDIGGLKRSAIVSFRERDVRQFRFDEANEIRLPFFDRPIISILIPCYNEFEITYECLLSLAAFPPSAPFEVILADDASTDAQMLSFGRIENLRVIRSEKNSGFLLNCNNAFKHARGDFVLLLNNDTQVTEAALSNMHRFLAETADAVAVGPKLLYPNGRLQEAGCRINLDGSTVMVGLAEDPDLPCYNYPRPVDYCSGAALLFRKDEVEGDLFDAHFSPAYCEDVDLCLRLSATGKKIYYLPSATIVHHLSVSTGKESETRRVQKATRNQNKLAKKWTSKLSELNTCRVIAFYLPQFHPIPENDVWWGKGFTEWTNVTRAKPSYVGHYQPHLPADLGFYDLRVAEVMGQQYKLARRYGIEGFCVYYYNFKGRKILETPIENLLRQPDVDFPFCLCWANENWTRNWDGGAKDILLEQDYDEYSLRSIAEDAARFAQDRRYIKVNDRPLFVIYRPLLIPDVKRATALIRRIFAERTGCDVWLAYVESLETAARGINPEEIGFDASIQFPPHEIAVPASDKRPVLKPDWNGYRYDYRETILNDLATPSPSYRRYPGVFAEWDNTARQPISGTSFDGVTPELFQAYLEAKFTHVKDFLQGDDRLLFINAWNEWAEGAHLEPDQRWGHRWLEAVRNAAITSGNAI